MTNIYFTYPFLICAYCFKNADCRIPDEKYTEKIDTDERVSLIFSWLRYHNSGLCKLKFVTYE